MLGNYLKITLRTLWREKGYTFINVTGLAVGFACCILIALFVRHELSYDRFHEDAERLMIFTEEGPFNRSLASPYPLADALKSNLPIVEETARILWPGDGRVSRDGQSFALESGVYHAEATFFELFSFTMLEGDRSTALGEPNTAVVSSAFAEKYFPGQDPIGQTFIADRYGEHEYRITGVAEPKPNSYLDFNALLSFSTLDYHESHADAWGGFMFLTFARVQEGTTPEMLTHQTNAMVQQYAGDEYEDVFTALPIGELYLSDFIRVDGFRGAWRYIYLFGTIALVILLLACVNYTNLMTARAGTRSKEVGVRRTIGALRGQVATQFWVESLLLCGVAFVFALALARAALPGFNVLFDKSLYLAEAGPFIAFLAAAALLVGVLAGSYPALYLSGFSPIGVLRSKSPKGASGERLRKGLVVFQFAMAAALLVSTLVIYEQLQYAQEKDLGFVGEQVLVTVAPDNPVGAFAEAVEDLSAAAATTAPRSQAEVFAHAVRSHSAVVSATAAQGLPGRFNIRLSRLPQVWSREAQIDSEEPLTFMPASVDHDYIQTLGLELVAGRDFSREHPSDEQQAYILNETAVQTLGWTLEEAIGKPFSTDGETEGSVIGVVRDFHAQSLREPIRPVVIHLHEGRGWSTRETVASRLASGALIEGREHIEAQWAQFSDQGFEYTFLDEQFAALYAAEQRFGQVFALFAGLAILIACLGLFGLAAYTAQRRTKEIGIRKVLGATVPNIIVLLSKDFATLVIIALAVGAPIAYLGMNRWLEDFAYRIEIGPGVFALAGLLALAIALLTVSFHAIRAALTDPARSLRYE